MTSRVEWDLAKNEANRQKHGIGFEEAAELFRTEVEFLELIDEAHSQLEERFIAIGPIRRGLVVIIWTEREEDVVRVISARPATKREAELFARFLEGR